MRDFAEIKPLKDQAELADLAKVAAEDGHRVIFPTHIVRKSGVIVGYASICAMTPLLAGAYPVATQFHVWFSTKQMGPRDSFQVINALENIAWSGCVGRKLVVPCTRESPFFAAMPAMGYAPVMETTLWAKERS